MPIPILDDIQTALQVPSMLRQALNTLQDEMPPEWATGSVKEVFKTLEHAMHLIHASCSRALNTRQRKSTALQPATP